ncbi:glycerol-3-phosphate acyltransferase [Cohnella herbarum]|uniref:Glycerol-3-phosphate acyltransferase n=1 Tax=Cohnella herbarum TaxID=2728023 RepID=A0A7Z2VJZ1_9BACL|nr:glycerol-3-phosphate acyltransferase [Cohnella herbarum]QJD84583.1 glycerol-3-phosphate acyltransferase [Cohnella herbarum]
MILLLIAAAFLSGSLMFSYWLGQLTKKNLRTVGDGNPGGLNLWKAAGFPLGFAGIALDFMKGYLPLLWLLGTEYAHGYRIVPLAIAPLAGHAFSPFLRGKGGKAIAVTFGVWSALTMFEASLAYAVILAVISVFTRLLRGRGHNSAEADGLQVVVGFLLLSVYLYISIYSVALLWIWFGNFAILAYTHRAEIVSWARRTYGRNKRKSQS